MATSSMSSSQTFSAHPRAPRLSRATSDPAHLATPEDESPVKPGQQPIYVLSADGSSLFLLDPTKPGEHEEPPPYASFTPIIDSPDTPPEGEAEGGPSSPRRTEVPFPSIDTAVLLSPEAHHRHRASTMSAIGCGTRRSASGHRSGTVSERPRPRYHSSFSSGVPDDVPPPTSGIRTTVSSPGVRHSPDMADESTPLLLRPDEASGEHMPRRRGFWGGVFGGELEDVPGRGFVAGWKRYWAPMGIAAYWRAMAHLVFLNFPFALFVWPPLVAGTLAGTALLITLPIGAAVWWLTLFISRSAARLETIMQLHHHSPLDNSIPAPSYHPIFYRIKERSAPTSPISQTASRDDFPLEVVWDKRFMKCSYAMFADHYSYSALSYFLLIKPLITLFSTIVVIALLPICFGLIFAIPIYLRASRRWGRWQAGVAIENL